MAELAVCFGVNYFEMVKNRQQYCVPAYRQYNVVFAFSKDALDFDMLFEKVTPAYRLKVQAYCQVAGLSG